jgi:hypothetical protein
VKAPQLRGFIILGPFTFKAIFFSHGLPLEMVTPDELKHGRPDRLAAANGLTLDNLDDCVYF